ncbi:MAG: hypothetical protein ACI4IF_01765 [Acutalibacteraceae bacterium]
MKKTISVILVALLLSFCLVLPAFAVEGNNPPTFTKESIKENGPITFSEDFKNLYYCGYQYSIINGYELSYNYDYIEDYNELNYDEHYNELSIDRICVTGIYPQEKSNDSEHSIFIDIELTEKQQNTVNYVDIYANSDGLIFDVTVEYKDYTTVNATFLRDDYLSEYNALINGEAEEYTVEFSWPEDNTVVLPKSAITSNETIVINSYDFDDLFSVYCGIKNGTLKYSSGEIHLIDNDYYYVDSSANEGVHGSGVLYTEETLKAVKITDPDAIEMLNTGLQKYYDDDLGYLYNDDLVESVSQAFLTILFALIPLIALAIFIVFAIKSKKKIYKKIYITASVLSFAEIISFIVTAYLLFK